MWIRHDNAPDYGYEVRETKGSDRIGYVRASEPGRHFEWGAWCDTNLTSFVCGLVGEGFRSRPAAAHHLGLHHRAKHR